MFDFYHSYCEFRSLSLSKGEGRINHKSDIMNHYISDDPYKEK
jgi:hypothetical protein